MSHLDYLIRQDVEHGTFSPQNIFNDEYLTPQFYTYAKQLEKLRCCNNCRHDYVNAVLEPCRSCVDSSNWEYGE